MQKYKAQNKKTKSYVAIKEIDKTRYNQLTKKIFNETEIMNIIKIFFNIFFSKTDWVFIFHFYYFIS